MSGMTCSTPMEKPIFFPLLFFAYIIDLNANIDQIQIKTTAKILITLL
jgi:hypothetical protein